MALSLLRHRFCGSVRRSRIKKAWTGVFLNESWLSSEALVLPYSSVFHHGIKLQTDYSLPWSALHCCPLHTCSCYFAGKDRRTRTAEKRAEFYMAKLTKKMKTKVPVWRNMTVEDMANSLEKHPKEVLSAMREFIEGATLYRKKTDVLNDSQIIHEICKLFGVVPQFIARDNKSLIEDENCDAYPRPEADPDVLVKRAPVVTVMGHVDHGKTTLLDSLRNANVVAGEFGGITQHIGAFSVKVGDSKVTFIDTPGHAAFTAMRSRGAHATDLVVLVVAADDGVMEQTIESIRMAKEAEVPIIVAINKIDKPQANIKRTEEMLAMHGIHTENMNGDVQAIPISALNGTNLDVLTEAILLQSEIMELKADPTGFVEGVVLESRVDIHRGKMTSALIRRGTLRKGAVLVAGTAYAKVRLMFDESGKQIKEAPPSTPVDMMGWRELPSAGDAILEVESEKRAHQVIQYRQSIKQKEKDALTAEELVKKDFDHKKKHDEQRKKAYEMGYRKLRVAKAKEYVEDTTPKVNVVLKGDVDGSVEAILDVLDTYHSEIVQLNIVNYGVGELTPNDVEMAATFNALVYSFNVKIPANVQALADEKKISLRKVNVIYRLVDDIKKEILQKTPTKQAEEILGEAEVKQQFEVNEKRKKLIVAGLKVTKGSIIKAERVRLLRKSEVIYDGDISSLRHLKNEVNSIKSGTECGLMLGDPTISVELGDTIVCYKTIEVPGDINWDPGF